MKSTDLKAPSRGRIVALARAIAAGSTTRTACGLTATPEATFFEWMRAARKIVDRLKLNPGDVQTLTPRDWQLVELLASISRAEAVAIARHAEIVRSAAGRDWRAAAWWLECRCPREYARKGGPAHGYDVMADNSDVRSPAEIAAAMDATIGGADRADA